MKEKIMLFPIYGYWIVPCLGEEEMPNIDK
jgi:hypothetical protein